MQRRFDSAFDKYLRRQAKRERYQATLGNYAGLIAVPSGRADYASAMVQLPTGIAEMEVRCTKVPRQAGLPVIVRRSVIDDVFEVEEQDPRQATTFWDGAGTGNVGSHASSHGYYGSDPLLISALQLQEFRVTPTDPPSLSVSVGPYLYPYAGVWKAFAGGTLSLTAKVPSAALNQRVIVVGIDGSSNTLTTLDGTSQYKITPGTSAQLFVLTDVAAALNANTVPDDFIPAAAVRLYNGQTAIQKWDCFADAKALAGIPRAVRYPPRLFTPNDAQLGTGPAFSTFTCAGAGWVIPVILFDKDAVETAYWVWPLPSTHSILSATLTIHWTSAVGAGDCVWKATHLTRADGEALDTAGTTETFDADPLIANGDDHRISQALDVSGWTPGELLLLAIARDATNGDDTLDNDAYFISAALELA